QQDLITARVAVLVVVRLEMIEVEMTGDEMPPSRRPLRELCLDLAVAGQSGERIGMHGRLDLLGGDLPQQIHGPAESQVAAVAVDDEDLVLLRRGPRRDDAAD